MMKLHIMSYAVYPLLLLIYHEVENMLSTVEQLCWLRWRILHIFYILRRFIWQNGCTAVFVTVTISIHNRGWDGGVERWRRGGGLLEGTSVTLMCKTRNEEVKVPTGTCLVDLICFPFVAILLKYYYTFFIKCYFCTTFWYLYVIPFIFCIVIENN